jgi:hypothetical protein
MGSSVRSALRGLPIPVLKVGTTHNKGGLNAYTFLQRPHAWTKARMAAGKASSSTILHNIHSEQARTPHTNGPRDVPRCGALSLLQKTLHYKGG